LTDIVAYKFKTNEKNVIYLLELCVQSASDIQFDRSFFREFEKNCIVKIQ